MHHVAYSQRVHGLRGLALAIGAIIAAVPAIIEELEAADGQRLVTIAALAQTRRYEIVDPKRTPPKYWPR